MPSAQPLGTFVGMSLSFLTTRKAELQAQLSSGVFTSTSGAGKSGTKRRPSESFEEVQAQLVEINYALGLLNGTRRVSRTQYDVHQGPWNSA